MAGERFNRSRARSYAPRTVFADLAIDALFRFPGADEVFIKSSEKRYMARGRSMIAQPGRIVEIVAREDVTPEQFRQLFAKRR
ncbi:hypothetical protein AA0535_2256 [Asaia krungthepensis NRIC 0535]|uniref:Uncharacterized protein n=1 Tax=Asaia krungthepensis NRIC 0535 TaxID=1307925 RepID=A0ABQ0Q4N4_9PROT|nr:hypothetical protein AA0535_2256 [Asaia krungthepensis NRIC 0535]